MKSKKVERRTEKFADRELDLKECKDFFLSNESILCISSKKNSGLSFFLLKLYEDEIFKNKKSRKIDIYLTDLSSKKELSSLIIENVLRQNQGWKFALAQKNIPLFVIKNVLTLGLPFIYLVSSESNIGFSIADSASSLINNEIPLTELLQKKIIKYFSKKKKPSVILIDSAEDLTQYDLDLVRDLIDKNIKFILAFRTTDDRIRKEKFFRLFPDKQIIIHSHDFHYPDETMLKELCTKYDKDYSVLKKSLLVASNDIIKIMSIITDNVLELSIEEKEILSFVYYSNGTINKDLLGICFNSNFKGLIYKNAFDEVYEQLINKNLIVEDNGNLTTDYVFEETLPNEIFYRLNICNIYYNDLVTRSLTQINFIINYEQQVLKKVNAILLFAKCKFKMGQNISNELALELNNSLQASEGISNKQEIEIILSIYYIKEFNYASALSVLEKSERKSRLLKKLYAYVLNRCHNLIESEKILIELIDNSKDINELAVLVSILTINYLHQNKLTDALDIYNNKSTICKYSQFLSSEKKIYFLRNIAYYLNGKDSLKCYKAINEICNRKGDNVFQFTTENNKLARDLVNGTMIAQEEVDKIIEKSKIIPYYEQRLFYNNLGIYYLEKDKCLSFEYFEKAIYLAKCSSELPYVFSKLNYALALAYYGDSAKASNIFEALEIIVNASKLVRIKCSYYATKLLFNYMIGEDITLCAQQLENYPLRKGLKFTLEYVNKIKSLINKNVEYNKKMFSSLYLKNVTFYWYIDILDLFDSKEILSL